MNPKRRPELLILDGATGAGKSLLLEWLRQEYSDVEVGTKLTTRKRREGEQAWEFRYVKSIPKRYSSFAFSSVGNYYAIDYTALSKAVHSGLTYALSCVDRRIVKRLAAEFNSLIFYVYRPPIDGALDQILISRRSADRRDSLARRDETLMIAEHYVENIGYYNHVLLNLGSKENLFGQLSRILLMHGVERKPDASIKSL